MHIKAPKDFWAGLMFIAFGLGFAYAARNYDMGTASRMGPAYFPTILGIVLAGLGLLLIGRSLAVTGDKPPTFHLRIGLILLGAIVLFGVLLRPFGLIAATITLVLVSTFAGGNMKIKPTLLLAAGLAVFAVLVFYYGLGLPFKLFPWE